MNRKIFGLFFLVSLILVSLCFSLAGPRKRQVKEIKSEGVPVFSGKDSKYDIGSQGRICELRRDNGTGSYYYSGFLQGDMVAVYLDPADCWVCPGDTFHLQGAKFTLFSQGIPDAYWPVEVEIQVRSVEQGDPCSIKPGAILRTGYGLVDSTEAEYPKWASINFYDGYYASHPFFLVFKYEYNVTPLPSVLFDNQTVTPCYCWFGYDSEVDVWYEWYEFWTDPIPGYPLLRAIIEVENLPPEIFCSTEYDDSVHAGDIFITDFEAWDPDNNLLGVTVRITPPPVNTPIVVGSHVEWQTGCADANKTFNICLEAADSCGAKDTCCFEVTVYNRAPQFIICPDYDSVHTGDTFMSIDFSVTDPDQETAPVTFLDIFPPAANNPDIVENHVKWVTTCDEEGDYVIRLVATDPCGLKDTCAFIVNVYNQPPWFPDCPEDDTLKAGDTLISTDFSVTDPEGDPTWVIFLDINPAATETPTIVNNHVKWATTCSEAGTYTIRLEAADSCGAKDTCAFHVMVINEPPEIVCPENDTLKAGDTLISTDFSVTDPEGDSTWVIFLDINPEAIDTPTIVNNHVEWVTTCSEVGTYTISLEAVDSCGAKDTCAFQVMVINDPPQIECPDSMIVHSGHYASGDFTIEHSDDSIVQIQAWVIPAGTGIMNLMVYGETGTPTSGHVEFDADCTYRGIYYICLQVTGECDLKDTCCFQVTIQNKPPQLTCPEDDSVHAGDTYVSTDFSVSDNDGDAVSVTFLDISHPAANNPAIVGNRVTWVTTCDEDGVYVIRLVATDTCGAKDTCEFTVNVYNRAPIFVYAIGDTSIKEAQTLRDTLRALDPDGDTLFFYAYSLPEGASLDSATGEFHWTPDYGQLGDYDSILFEVTDGQLADSEYVKITVNNKALEVRTHYPASNDSDVLIDDTISITLTEPIKCETVDRSTFKVESEKRGEILEGDYACDSSGLLRFSLPSDSMFPTLDTITVTVTTGVLDLTGYGMDHDSFWEFYTGVGVYPGNTNNDTTVDERDILPLGFYWGETGPARKEEYRNTLWSIKPAHRWDPDDPELNWDPPSAVYADANGNGVVNDTDICAVADNWESKISASPQNFQEGIEFLKKDHQEYLSIYEKIYNALLNCPESKGKSQIKKFLEEILENKNRPSRFEVFQNYPNPFNSITVIRYSLPEDCQVEIRLFNILGQKVKTLVNEYQTSGYKKVFWDGKDDQGEEVGSGIYFYQVKAQSFSCTQKLLFLK